MQRAFRQASQEEYQKAAELQKGGSDYYCLRKEIEVFTPAEGDNAIRIVPFLSDDPHGQIYGKEVWQYYMGGVYISPSTFDRSISNPLLERFMELQALNDERKKRFKGTRRYVMYVIEIDSSGKASPVKVWFAPKTIVDSIIAAVRDYKTGRILPVDDAREGRIMFFRREGKGLSTRYLGLKFDMDPWPLDMNVLNQIYLLEELLLPMTVDQARGFVEAGGYDDSDQAAGSQQSYVPPASSAASRFDNAPQSNPNVFGNQGAQDFDYGYNVDGVRENDSHLVPPKPPAMGSAAPSVPAASSQVPQQQVPQQQVPQQQVPQQQVPQQQVPQQQVPQQQVPQQTGTAADVMATVNALRQRQQ